MANKGEDSNTTTTEDNISLNEVINVHGLFFIRIQDITKLKWNEMKYACMVTGHVHTSSTQQMLVLDFNHIKTEYFIKFSWLTPSHAYSYSFVILGTC